jgi:UDP-glucose 4-epimerase
MGMNILVTGGAGFIASHVADACCSAGHRVSIVDDLSMGRMENVNPAAEFHKLDIRSAAVIDLFRKQHFDIVIHHAAQMDIRKSVDDPAFDASVNILGSINLLECCRITGVQKFIFASSGGAVYGEQERFPADESHATNPCSPYGIAKLAVEKYLYYYKDVYGIRYIGLRYANVYGPRQNPQGEAGVVAIFGSRMLEGTSLTINGDGTQTRDYVFVDDVVAANMAVLNYGTSAVFNVGTGIETDVNTLFHLLNSLTGGKAREQHGPAKKGEQQRSVLDTSRLSSLFGWKPGVQLEEGLKRTVEFFRAKAKS